MTDRLHLELESGYNLWASIYDEEQNPLITLEEPVVRGWIADPATLRVADVGCGTGRHSTWLAGAGALVDAYDCSAGMMAKAREKLAGAGVRFHEYKLPTPLPAVDDTFDVALLALVADHLEDLTTPLREIRRVVKPGGRVVVTVLHPAMNLLGVTARFTDPDSGREVRVRAFEHTFGDYVTAVLGAGLNIDEIVERNATAEIAQCVPRMEKYVGWPLLLAMCLRK